MQVPPEPTALLLAGDDEPLPRPREIVPQSDRADRGSRLSSEVLEQSQLVAAEAGLTGAHTQHEPSNSFGAVDEWHIHGDAALLAAFGHDAFGAVHIDERERHERKPQRVGDRVDDRGERAVGFRGPLEHVAEPMHRAPWLVAVAVHQPVHGSLQHVAQRQRDERGRAGRQQLDPDPVSRFRPAF